MTADPIRRVLRALLPRHHRTPRELVVQQLGLDGADVDGLPAVLDEVGRELGLTLRLHGGGGDIVVADHDFVARVAPQVLHAFLEDRLLVTVRRTPPSVGDARQRARDLHGELVRQLRGVALRPRREAGPDLQPDIGAKLPASSGFDSGFDSSLHAHQLAEAELDPDRAELLNRLRRGLVDPAQPPLLASYGPQANLRLDFEVGLARMDELADQRLRIAREVPYLAPAALPGIGAKSRDLDLVAWDIASAAGHFRLMNSPVNWWHAPLLAQPHLDITRFSRLPRHVELARRLSAAPASPAELRRQARVGLGELRGFLQGGLFLGLLHWMPSAGSRSGS